MTERQDKFISFLLDELKRLDENKYVEMKKEYDEKLSNNDDTKLRSNFIKKLIEINSLLKANKIFKEEQESEKIPDGKSQFVVRCLECGDYWKLISDKKTIEKVKGYHTCRSCGSNKLKYE